MTLYNWLNVAFNIGVPVLLFFAVRAVYRNLRGKSQARQQIKSNQRTLVSEICSMARQNGGFVTINAAVSISKNHAAVFIERYSGAMERYGFRDHGFRDLDYYGMTNLFDQLKAALGGSVEIEHETVGGSGSRSVSSVSTAFTPGGGSGYQVNYTDSSPSSTPKAIILYSREETARRNREAQMAKANRDQYRKTF